MNILTSYHPALLAMQSLHDQFPGALEFFLFCNHKGIRVYHSKGKNKGIFLPTDISVPSNNPVVQKFRQRKKEILWGDKDDLPIGEVAGISKPFELKQLSIQDEIEQNVLIFRLQSKNDDAFDVFAISFSKTFSNFYIASGRNSLSSDLKKSIGKTIRNQVDWLYQLHQKQNENITRIQSAYLQNLDALEIAQDDIEKEQQANKELLSRYLMQLISEQEIALDVKIVLKKGFLEKIKEGEVAIEQIKKIVEAAVLTAYDLSIDKSIIYLTPNLIQLNDPSLKSAGKSAQLIELDRTHALLDRYEQAARQLKESSQRINGRNLAQALEISAPAVTDAIKKHNAKIKRLLEKYPSKWPLICDFIRPIREIKWALASNE